MAYIFEGFGAVLARDVQENFFTTTVYDNWLAKLAQVSSVCGSLESGIGVMVVGGGKEDWVEQ